MLTISGGDVWRCELPEDELPRDPKARAAILKDYEGRWGDRRQELVFIGQKMREGVRQRIQAAMDACLLDDDEFRDWERVMDDAGGDGDEEALEEKLAELFDDGFEDWVPVAAQHDHAGGEGGAHHGHHH